MSFLKKYKLWIIGAAVVIIVIGLLVHFIHKPIPANTDFITDTYTFNYPRTYATEEYAPGVVSIGHAPSTGFVPLIEVDRYQSDPQATLPKSFDVFVKQQASAICGSDDSIESITCSQADIAAYTSAKGLVGQKMDLTMVRKNLKTGTTTSATYGPFYIFNTSPTKAATKDMPFRYSGIFVYPSFSAFLAGTTTPALLAQVIDTLTIPAQK